MSPPDYTDNWQRYWASSYDGGRRLQIQNAASDPRDGWLTADVPALVEEDVGIDPQHVRDFPDLLLEHGRDGFRDFVLDSGVADGTDDPEGYDLLPIHLAGATRVRGIDFTFEDPVRAANSVRVFRNVEVTDAPTRRVQPSVVTFRCPLGHETRLRQPLLRRWMVERCGELDCSNDVVPVDTDTRVRRVATFTVSCDGATYPCTAAGRYAGETTDATALAEATTLLLTAVL
ncbi:MAG: hypothetical protein R3324_12045, partial [Halobacteriales archaeon]|nr:hypothetical protein [Halobacteriales archaeon]